MRKLRLGTASLIYATSLLLASHAQASPSIELLKRQHLGWAEVAEILPQGFQLKAKLDTGADRTSLHAENVEIKESKTVSFTSRNHRGQTLQLSLPLHSHSKVKNHSSRSERRPVVELTLCLGSTTIKGLVTLTDRENYQFPLLIGRDMLQFAAIVDSSLQFQSKPLCSANQRRERSPEQQNLESSAKTSSPVGVKQFSNSSHSP